MTPVGVEGALTFWARTAPELEAKANVKANERTIMDDQLRQANDSDPGPIGA